MYLTGKMTEKERNEEGKGERREGRREIRRKKAEWQREGDTQKDLPSFDSLLKLPQNRGLARPKLGSWNLQPNHSQGFQGPKYLGHHLLLSKDASVGSWIRSSAARTQTCAHMGYWRYKWQLNHCTTTLTPPPFLSICHKDVTEELRKIFPCWCFTEFFSTYVSSQSKS